MTTLLEARGISKRFGGVQALNNVDFSASAGEVIGLMGDNGAGKSTLMKTLAGAHQPDDGTITLRGEASPCAPRGTRPPREFQWSSRISALVDTRDVAANVYLGRELTRFGFLRKKEMRANARDVVNNLGIRIESVRTNVGGMSGGQRQGVAIARAVHQGGDIVLLDEPTAALGPEQQANVLDLIRTLRRQNKTVIVVSHNVDHVMAVADRVVVMRAGRVAGVRTVAETTPEEIIHLIVGTLDVSPSGIRRHQDAEQSIFVSEEP